MNWYCKNIETFICMVGVIMIFLGIVDIIWAILHKGELPISDKLPLFIGFALSAICLLGLIITLPVWFEAPKIFVMIISPSSTSVWWGWVYAAKTIFAFLLLTPLLSILGIVFSARALLPHTWIF